MQLSRKQMEAEADRLGVPWTYSTTDEQLRDLIQSRLRGDNMANEEFTTPECYGEFWDFPKQEVCKGCPGQQGCFQKFHAITFPKMQAKLGTGATLAQLAKALDVSQEAVLVAMNQQSKAAPPPVPAPVQTSLPEAEEPEEEETEEEVEEEEDGDYEEDEGESEEHPALQQERAMVHQQELDQAMEGELEDADELEDELEAEPDDVEPEVSAPDEPEPPPPETEMATKKKTKKQATKKAASKKAPAKKAPAKKKAAAKKPAKKPAATPPPVSSTGSEVQNPTKAESAKTATGSAKSKARAKSAPRAKGQAGPSKTGGGAKGKKRKPVKKPSRKAPSSRGKDGHVEDPWGAHTWEKRYQRERKNKDIKALRPGMKLKREYQGETHEVTVLKQFYRYKGQDYPTLYTIVKEITGTKEAPRQLDKKGKRPKGTRQLCNWSAPKFFGLKGSRSKR